MQHRESFNRSTGEAIGRYALAGEHEARDAAAVALRAFSETSWKHDRVLRSRVLLQMAERFEARAADLIRLLGLETGKVMPEAEFEVSHAARGCDIVPGSC